jgi:heme-degrading monooxygenase HmoA
MIEVFYRYRVHPAQARAFEHAYGPSGPWAALFSANPGYVRTRLFRHKQDPNVYVTVDVWRSKADWEAFCEGQFAQREALDRQFKMLRLEEALLGYYEGEGEYHAPIDTQA